MTNKANDDNVTFCVDCATSLRSYRLLPGQSVLWAAPIDTDVYCAYVSDASFCDLTGRICQTSPLDGVGNVLQITD